MAVIVLSAWVVWRQVRRRRTGAYEMVPTTGNVEFSNPAYAAETDDEPMLGSVN